MKGAIFSGFSEYVEKEFGLSTWLQTIDSCQLASNGEYLATELYEDNEFVIIVDALVERVGTSREEIYRGFGHYFFPFLMSIVIKSVEDITNLFDFLRAVDTVIHIEVRKSDALAYTPTLLYDQPHDDVLIIRYLSHRKMCHFAEGLILGAADYFHQEVKLSQSKCVCKGDEHCLIRVELQ
jgi:predicted hydrocarbon binding protein